MTATAAAAEWHIRVLALLEGGTEAEFQVVVLADATVGDFRGKLATRSCIEPQKQRLIFRGRLLTDDAQKLADAGLSDGSALHMVARSTAAAAAQRPSDSDSAQTPSSGRQSGRGRQTWHFVHDTGIQLPSLFGIPNFSALGGPPQQRQQARQPQPPPPPQPLQNPERTIREVHRNFGADDGGEWMAITHSGQYYRISHEAEAGSILRDDVLQHGLISTPYPISRRSESASYEPLPGIVPRPTPATPPEVPADGSARDMLARVLEHAQAEPSQAQANELIHDLFEYVLPAIRATPGHSNYHYGGTDALRPTYLSRTEPSPIAATGAALSNLGDAFAELSRSLQAVGAGWQAHGDPTQSSDDNRAIEEQARGALRLFSELAVVAPLAVPFLQARLAQGQSPSRAADTPQLEQGSRIATPSTSSQGMVSDHQLRIVRAHTRRRRRYKAFRMATGSPEPSAPTHTGNTPRRGRTAMTGMRVGTMSVRADSMPASARPQGTTQEAADAPASHSGATADAAGSGRTSGTRYIRFTATARPIEVVIGPAAAPEMLASSQQRQQQQRQRQQLPEAATQATNIGEIFARAFGAPAPPTTTPGAQSVRSDRSNDSMVTEHSASGPSTRPLHVFGPAGSSTLESGPTIDGMFQQLLTRLGNPFPTASVFLGTEAGRPDPTAAAPPTTTAGDGGQPPDEAAPPAPAASAAPAPAAPAPRTGEMRGRTLSSASSNDAEAGESSCPSHPGPSKRHRAGD
ncbi:hypothetical protein H4R19_002063 [Coemansia spiralis]|nr:hypothetical protein H4R19_002063 [Coemansia spiralis]